MESLKPWIERLGLLAFGVASALLVAEVGLRWLGIGGPVTLPPTFDRIERQYYPDWSLLNPWVGEDDTEVLRVAFVGDSFTVGEANGWQDAYPWRLQRLLNMNVDVPPAEVRVFGRRGTATFDQLPFLKEALAFEPDLMILGMFLNDPEDPHGDYRELWRERSLPWQPTGWQLRALRSSRIAEWIYLRLQNRRVRQGLDGHMRAIYDRQSAGWAKFEQALSRFADDCRRHDVRLVAVIFPAMGALASAETYPNAWAHLELRAELEERSVPYLDLLETFLGTSDTRMAAFPQIDSHPSEIAHRLAARAIFEYLLEAGHLDPGYRPINSRREQKNWLGLARRVWNPLYP